MSELIQEIDPGRGRQLERRDEVVRSNDKVLQREALVGFDRLDVCERPCKTVNWWSCE